MGGLIVIIALMAGLLLIVGVGESMIREFLQHRRSKRFDKWIKTLERNKKKD
jgi:uncharacterized membrane protein YdjX (TVP38/TMEM64 family)